MAAAPGRVRTFVFLLLMYVQLIEFQNEHIEQANFMAYRVEFTQHTHKSNMAHRTSYLLAELAAA